MSRALSMGIPVALGCAALLVIGCKCESSEEPSSSLAAKAAELHAEMEEAELVALEGDEEDDEDTDTEVDWPTGPRPHVPTLPAPTLALAGADRCTLSGPHVIGEHPRSSEPWRKTVEIGFGADGGLVAYTFGKETAFLRPVDAQGKPSGDAVPFVQDIEVGFKALLAHSRGFVLLGSEELKFDQHLMWITDPVGKRPAARTKLPIDGTRIIARSDVVGDRLLLVGRDKWGVRLLLASISPDGTVDFPVDVEHTVVDVMQKGISADVALGDEHGVVVISEEDVRTEGREYEYLFVDGEKRELVGDVPVPMILEHDLQAHRLAWHEGVLHVLSGDDDPGDEGAPLIMTDPSGARVVEQGIAPEVTFRYGEFEDNLVTYGEPVTQSALAELKPPFSQRVVLDVGSAQATRMTQLGLVGVGEPVDLEELVPRIEDPTYAEWAWSGSHFVVVYLVTGGDKSRVMSFALDCRK